MYVYIYIYIYDFTIFRESVDVAFGDVAFQICENGVFKEKNVRLNSAGCEPHSRSDECFLFENPIFTLLKRHVRKRHVYRLPRCAARSLPCSATRELAPKVRFPISTLR